MMKGMVITTCAINSETHASRSPNSRIACSMAIPSTSPGSMSGETMKVATASAPGRRPRTRAMAQSVPSSREIAVERAAICAERPRAESSPSTLRMRQYHCSEKPSGGKAKIGASVKDTGITTTIGSNRKAIVRNNAKLVSPFAKRSMSSFLSPYQGGVAGWPRQSPPPRRVSSTLPPWPRPIASRAN